MDQAKAFLSSPVHKEHLSLLFSGIYSMKCLDLIPKWARTLPSLIYFSCDI